MRHFIGVLLMVVVIGCQEVDTPTDLTGYETTYELVSGSQHDVKGIVTFKERIDGFTTVVISLSGTGGEAKHPVHMHLGDLSTPNADVAAILNPVFASTGKSETVLTSLTDETQITYADITALKACIKIHLADTGPEREIVLAGGNIGKSYIESISTGQKGTVTSCKSEGE